jgi:hypothetical protein
MLTDVTILTHDNFVVKRVIENMKVHNIRLRKCTMLFEYNGNITEFPELLTSLVYLANNSDRFILIRRSGAIKVFNSSKANAKIDDIRGCKSLTLTLDGTHNNKMPKADLLKIPNTKIHYVDYTDVVTGRRRIIEDGIPLDLRVDAALVAVSKKRQGEWDREVGNTRYYEGDNGLCPIGGNLDAFEYQRPITTDDVEVEHETFNDNTHTSSYYNKKQRR